MREVMDEHIMKREIATTLRIFGASAARELQRGKLPRGKCTAADDACRSWTASRPGARVQAAREFRQRGVDCRPAAAGSPFTRATSSYSRR